MPRGTCEAGRSGYVESWNFRDLPEECINRKLPIAIRHSLQMVNRNGVEDIGGKPELPAQSLESMSPRMTWREPLVSQTEAPDPSSDSLCAVTASLPEP